MLPQLSRPKNLHLGEKNIKYAARKLMLTKYDPIVN